MCKLIVSTGSQPIVLAAGTAFYPTDEDVNAAFIKELTIGWTQRNLVVGCDYFEYDGADGLHHKYKLINN